MSATQDKILDEERVENMSIEKKSLISTLKSTKKANVAKDEMSMEHGRSAMKAQPSVKLAQKFRLAAKTATKNKLVAKTATKNKLAAKTAVKN